MKAAVPREILGDERRVAVIPAGIAPFTKAGIEIHVEAGAGAAAGFPDDEYRAKGATVVESRDALFADAEMILTVQGFRARSVEAGESDIDLARLRPGQIVVGLLDPLSHPKGVAMLAERNVMAFALELMPRITRAQSMDVLSSMATISGYKAVLLAAAELPRMFPMLMTAAGTISPARVFVIGVGVAGLQAIATARRLGAVVEAYDVRPAVKEQVQSVGAKFVELPLEVGGAEDKGGYAKAQDEEFYRKQRELMARVVAENDVVITTAAVPGKRAPLLLTADMVKGMKPTSIIVDLAADSGGNCELTRPGETVVEHGVTILGPRNLPATVPQHASQLYSRNVSTFLAHVVKEGVLELSPDDEISRETLVCRNGEVTAPRIREALGLTEAKPKES